MDRDVRSETGSHQRVPVLFLLDILCYNYTGYFLHSAHYVLHSRTTHATYYMLRSAHNTLHAPHYTLHTTHSTLYTLRYTLHNTYHMTRTTWYTPQLHIGDIVYVCVEGAESAAGETGAAGGGHGQQRVRAAETLRGAHGAEAEEGLPEHQRPDGQRVMIIHYVPFTIH